MLKEAHKNNIYLNEESNVGKYEQLCMEHRMRSVFSNN